MKMRQNKKQRWVYEWPMQMPKVKWLVREMMVKRQQRLLRRWMRYAKTLRPIEKEEMVQVCEPKTGRGLDDDEEDELGSSEDLKDCQEGREEIPDCQEGNKIRSTEDLTDCHEDSEGILHCQLGNDQRLLRDLEDCQEGSRSIEDCHEGSRSVLNCQMGKNEHSRLSKSLADSEESSIQPGVLMKMGSVDLMVAREVAAKASHIARWAGMSR
jgi:hypothetical protein